MNTPSLVAGTVHAAVPADFADALRADAAALAAWSDTTVLARNEWLCWAESAKLIETRARRISRAVTELGEGMRRPCCWPGCIHREKNGK